MAFGVLGIEDRSVFVRKKKKKTFWESIVKLLFLIFVFSFESYLNETNQNIDPIKSVIYNVKNRWIFFLQKKSDEK